MSRGDWPAPSNLNARSGMSLLGGGMESAFQSRPSIMKTGRADR